MGKFTGLLRYITRHWKHSSLGYNVYPVTHSGKVKAITSQEKCSNTKAAFISAPLTLVFLTMALQTGLGFTTLGRVSVPWPDMTATSERYSGEGETP